MTQEWMLKTLIDLGFTQHDAEVYVFLTLNGSQEASIITKTLKTYKRQVYRALSRLIERQLVTTTADLPAQFSAVPFDKVLDLLMKVNIEEANRLEQKREVISSLWKEIARKESST